VGFIQISQDVQFPDFSPSVTSVRLVPYMKHKSGQSGTIRTVGSPGLGPVAGFCEHGDEISGNLMSS
jgi:hypothetical protein